MGVCVLRPQTRGFAANALREKENYIEDLRLCRGSSSYNFSLQKAELPRRKRRRSSKHPSSFFYNCFTTINCQNWGSYYMVSPNFGRNYNCGKIPIHLQKIVVFWNPCAFARGFLFSLWEMWFPSFCRRHLRAQRARGVCASTRQRPALKKRKCGRGNTYNNYYGVSFLPTHWKWWSRLPSSQHFPL